jgi:hypothetical protein
MNLISPESAVKKAFSCMHHNLLHGNSRNTVFQKTKLKNSFRINYLNSKKLLNHDK